MKFFVTSKLSENIAETPEGYLVCKSVSIARTGEMVYAEGETPIPAGPDGRVVIDRNAEEVFRKETLASFEGKAVTIGHPNEFVSPSNWTSLTKGMIQNVRRGQGEQENDVVADLLITDAVAIQSVKNGLREVSCGYEAEYIQTGEGRGLQTNIIGNHLALVSEGRAGSSYAIYDHKGKGSEMKISDRIKAIFGKAQDEALSLVKDEAAPEEKKEEKAKDAMGAGYDELCKMVKDLGSKLDSLKPQDASSQPTQSQPAEVKAGDSELPSGGAVASVEERLKKLEELVASMAQAKSGDESSEEKPEEAKDEDGDDDEVVDEEGEEEVVADTADAASDLDEDTASRVEILAPGLKASAKDAKIEAIKACYQTTDGKSLIERFTNGAAPDYKNDGQVGMIFIAASEILKAHRNSTLSKTRTFDIQKSIVGTPKGSMTPEALNKKMAEHYKA